MNSKGPADVALEFVERINVGDLEGLTALMTEDHTFVDLEGDVERGREAMREGWAGFFSAFPEYTIHVSRVAALESVVIIIGNTTGSQVPPEIEAQETVIWAARIEGGLVAEWHIVYADTAKVKGFLGWDPGQANEDV
jgi:uncharacterized protein (TIGR02246 family)